MGGKRSDREESKSFCDFEIGIIEMCRKCIFVGKLPFSHPHKCSLTVVGSFRISIVYFIYIYIIFRHQHHCGCNLDGFYFGLSLFVIHFSSFNGYIDNGIYSNGGGYF